MEGDNDEFFEEGEEVVNAIQRARATIARTRERHRMRMMKEVIPEDVVETTTTTTVQPPPPPPTVQQQQQQQTYKNKVPDKLFLSTCRKLCRSLNQRLKRERKSTKIAPRSIEDLNRDVVLFRHIVAQHIRDDSKTMLKPSFVKGKCVEELRAYLEEHMEQTHQEEKKPPKTPGVKVKRAIFNTTKLKSPVIKVSNKTPLHYHNSVSDIALRAKILSRVRRFLLTRSFSSENHNETEKNFRRVDRGQRQHRRHRLEQIFEEQFDLDSRGRLGMRELRNLFQVLTSSSSSSNGKKIPKHEIRAFKHVMDLNEDSKVTRDDFVNFMDREISAARLHIQSFNNLISYLKQPTNSSHGGKPWTSPSAHHANNSNTMKKKKINKKETKPLISAPFPDARIDRDGRIRVIVLEPATVNLEYSQISSPSMTQRLEKKTWVASFLKNYDDHDRRVVAVRVAPSCNPNKRDVVRIKVVNRNVLRAFLPERKRSLLLEDDEEEEDNDEEEEENELEFLSRVRNLLRIHAVSGDHIQRLIRKETDDDVRTIFTRLGIKSLTRSDLSRLNRVLEDKNLTMFEVLRLRKNQKEEEDQHQQHRGTVFRFPSSVYSHNASAKDMWSKTGLPALRSLWNGLSGSIVVMGCSNSGKSHTLFGGSSNSDTGLLKILLNRLFILVDHHNDEDNGDESCSVSLSVAEFNSESILDLLRPDSRTKLQVIRSKWIKSSYVEGLSDHSVFSARDGFELLMEALRVRALSASNRNVQRGESSLVINVCLHRYSKQSGNVLSTSTLRFVDTASCREILSERECFCSITSLFRSIGSLCSTADYQEDTSSSSLLTRLLQDDIVGSRSRFSCWIGTVRADTEDVRDDVAMLRCLEILSSQQHRQEEEKPMSLESTVNFLSKSLEHANEEDARSIAISLSQHQQLLNKSRRSMFERFWQTSVDAGYRAMLLKYAGISNSDNAVAPLLDVTIETPESLLELLRQLREEQEGHRLNKVAASRLNKDEPMTSFWSFCKSLARVGIHAPSEITRTAFESVVVGSTRAEIFGVKSFTSKKQQSNWHLVNLSEDNILNEILSFNIESSIDVRRVGSLNSENSAIHLAGLGVQNHHCTFDCTDEDILNVDVTNKSADVFVNGQRILEQTRLRDGDSVVLGFSHYFVVRRGDSKFERRFDLKNLKQIRCNVARSRLTKHKRRHHSQRQVVLSPEDDVITCAMHYVCEANAIGTTLKQPVFFKLEQSSEISFEDNKKKEKTLIVARRALSNKKSQLLFRCVTREFADSIDRLRSLHLFFEPKIPQEFARSLSSLSSHVVDEEGVPMELPDDNTETKNNSNKNKTQELMSKFGDLSVEENAQKALDFVAAMWWWLPSECNSLMPPRLSAEDTLRRFLRCFQKVPSNVWETPQILERVMRIGGGVHNNNNSFVDEFLDPEDSSTIPRDAKIAALMTENSRMAKKLYSIERDHIKQSHHFVTKEIEFHGREMRDKQKEKELENKYDEELRIQRRLLNRDFQLSQREREDEKLEKELERRKIELESMKQALDQKDEEERRFQNRFLDSDLKLQQREGHEDERKERQREVTKIVQNKKNNISQDTTDTHRRRRNRMRELGLDVDQDDDVVLTDSTLLDIANEVAQVTVRADADLKEISSHVTDSFRSRISKALDKISKATHREMASPHVKHPAFISGSLEHLRDKLINSLDMLQAAFNTIDSTGDGKLTMEEFEVGLREAVENITPAEMRVARKIVEDPCGFVDHFGFITMIRELKGGE